MSFFSKCFKPAVIFLCLAIMFSGCSTGIENSTNTFFLLSTNNSENNISTARICISLSDMEGNTVTKTSTRNAAPSVFENTFCYAGLVKKGTKPSDSILKTLSFENDIWYYQMKPSEMLNNGNYELYIYAGPTEQLAKSIKKAPLMTKLEITLTQTTLNYNASAGLFINKDATSNGKVELKIKTAENSGLNYVVSSLSDGTNDYIDTISKAQTITGNEFTITAGSVPPGAYTLTMKFYNQQNGSLIFFRTESVEVWSGCETTKWLGRTGNTLEALEISSEMMNTTYFVRGTNPELYGSSITSEAASDTSTGGITAPLQTIQEAVKRINAKNNGTTKYTIYLDGTEELTDTLTIDSEKDLTLNLCSLSGKEAKAVIDGKNIIQCLHVGSDSSTKTISINLKDLTITNGKSETGAGLFIEKNAEVTMLSGKICENVATANGGGIFNKGKFILEGGTITDNSAGEKGGAVYNLKTFVISKTGTIPYGVNGTKAETKNDVFLAKSENVQTLLTVEPITLPSEEQLAAITIDWERGLNIIETGTNLNKLDTYSSRFELTGDGWELMLTGNEKCFYTDSPIYIAGETIYTGCGAPGNDTSGTGTKALPFKTISQGCSLMNNKDCNYTVIIAGEINGAHVIPSIITKEQNAAKITIRGASQTNIGKINGGFTQDSTGTSLRINTNIPVVLENIEITGGYSSDYAGGLYIDSESNVTLGTNLEIKTNTAEIGAGIYNKGTLLMTENSKVSNNNAQSYGGGIYNQGILYMEGTSSVSNNHADITGTGGGILNSGKVFLYGNSVIGEPPANVSEPAGTTETAYSNSASIGAGIANMIPAGDTNTESPVIKIGYKNLTETDENSNASICYNYSTLRGSGIYLANGSIEFAKGTICKNRSEGYGTVSISNDSTAVSMTMYSGSVICENLIDCGLSDKSTVIGGGIYLGNNGTVTMQGTAKIESNQAYKGAGIYIDGSSSDAILNLGTGETDCTPEIKNNTATGAGGAICIETSKAVVNMKKGAVIRGNKVSGGISNCGGGGVFVSQGTFSMNGGSMISNTIENALDDTVQGGAVDMNTSGTFKIQGEVSIPYGGAQRNNDIKRNDSNKTITLSGELILNENDVYCLTIVPYTYSSGQTCIGKEWINGTSAVTTEEYCSACKKIGVVPGIDTSTQVLQNWEIGHNSNTNVGQLGFYYGVPIENLKNAPSSADFTKLQFESKNELIQLQNWVKDGNTLKDIEINLMDNIDTEGESVTIGKYANYAHRDERIFFEGKFNGNYKTITNAISESEFIKALFSAVKNVEIKNLNIAGTSDSGALIGYLEGSNSLIENCKSSVSITCASSNVYAAGIVCYINGSCTINKCTNEGNINKSSYSCGGIVGSAFSDNIFIENCTNKGNLTNTSSSNGGGIAGYVQGNNIMIRNCKNIGTIEGYNRIGGITAYFSSTGGSIINCCNSGTITYTGQYYYGAGIVAKVVGSTGSKYYNNINNESVYYGISAEFNSETLTDILNNYSLSGKASKGVYSKSGQSSTGESEISGKMATYTADDSSKLSALNDWVNTENASNTDFQYSTWKFENGMLTFDIN